MKDIIRKIKNVIIKIILVVGTIFAFYKLPNVIAQKINYIQIKKKEIKQNITEEK